MLAARVELRTRDNASATRLLTRATSALGAMPPETVSVDERMLHRLCYAELSASMGKPDHAIDQIRAGLEDLRFTTDWTGAADLVCGTAIHGRELAELAISLVTSRADGTLDGAELLSWLEQSRAPIYRYRPDTAVPDAQDVSPRIIPTSATMRRAPAPTPETQRELITALGSRALAEFALLGEQLLALVVVDGQMQVVRIDDPAAISAAEELHADLDALAPDWLSMPLVQAVLASAQRRAARLDAAVLDPLIDAIGERELVIVPAGALYSVAWGVLPRLRGRPVVVVPSASVWLSAWRSVRRTRSPEEQSVLLVRGPHVGGGGDLAGISSQYRGRLFCRGGRRPWRPCCAMDGAHIVHIAANIRHERGNALFSRLELADGSVFAHDVMTLRKPPRLVVLATSELQLGRIGPGDDALGFADGLLTAGVGTVIAAVTRVGMAASQELRRLHERLRAGRPPAQAVAAICETDPFSLPLVCLGLSDDPLLAKPSISSSRG